MTATANGELDQLPPHSLEAEEGVLGCIMLSATECLDVCQQKLAGPEVFYDLRHRTIYEAMLDMRSRSVAIDTITLPQWLKDWGRLDGVGGLGLLSRLADDVPSAANLGYYLEIVRKKFGQRQLIANATTVSKLLMAGQTPTERQLEELQIRCADALAGEASDRLKQLSTSRLFDPSKPPLNVPPVFTICGVPACTRGNVTVIDAQAKAGKTALVGAMLAAVLRSPARSNSTEPKGLLATLATSERVESQNGTPLIDTFGISAENPAGLRVLHFDTEQSREHHWQQIDRIRRRARLESLPSWFQSYWLSGIPLRDLRSIIEDATRERGIHSIFIDGVADLVADVNDAEECNRFVAYLHALAIRCDCPVIVVIHRNPNGEKTRGHLGSQLERKAESNLTMEKDGEVTTVWSVKQRGAPILKGKGPTFAWSDEAGMHVSCTVQNQRLSMKVEQMKCERDDVFNGHPSMRYTDLVLAVESSAKCSERSAKRKISEWTANGVIERSIANLYVPTN